MNATYEIQFGHLQRPTHCNTSWDWAKYEVGSVCMFVCVFVFLSVCPSVRLSVGAFHYAKRSVRDQWEYPKKMGRQFTIKLRQLLFLFRIP